MKIFFTIALLFILFGSFSGVTQVVAEEKTLVVVAPWKIKGINLDKSGFLFARMGCIEMLTSTDESGSVSGFLAESWTLSPDHLTWTFTLRPDVTFHDNKPLTAAAAARSLNISVKNKAQLSKAGVVSIKPIDALTIEIVTEAPFASLPAHLAHYSAGIISPASYDGNDQVVTLNGTGQYIFIQEDGGIRYQFKANHQYWGAKPQVEYAEYHAVPKGETRGLMLKSGQADMAFTLTPSDAGQLATSSKVKIHTLTIPRSRILILNCSLPLFSDVRVRKAMSMAINREGIATGLLKNPASAATQLLAPSVAMWHNKNLAPLTFDPEGAKALLAEAGWKPGKDGILEKDGVLFQFEVVTYAARPMLPPIAAAIQQQFLDVGIVMSVNVGESSLIPDKNGDGTLQAALVARNFGQIPDAFGNIYGDFGPEPSAWGPIGWQSERLNQLLADYLAEFDKKKSGKIRDELIAILQVELPVIPVTWYEHIVGVNDRIDGIAIDPFEIKSYIRGATWVK